MSDLTKEKERLLKEVLGRKRAWEEESDSALKDAEDARNELNDILKRNQNDNNRLMDEMQAELKKDYGIVENKDEKQVFDEALHFLKTKVYGEEEALEKLVQAFRRPYVMGISRNKPAALISIQGPEGTGKHLSLKMLADFLHRKNYLHSSQIDTVDLSRYADSADEQIFVQDLYAALSSDCDVICFEKADKCFPGFIQKLSELFTEGRMSLKKRYVLSNGMLVENQTGLVKKTVDSIQADGKFLVFLQDDNGRKIDEIFSKDVLSKILDRISFQTLSEDILARILKEKCAAFIQQCSEKLSLALTINSDAEEWILHHYDRQKGCTGMQEILHSMYTAVSSIMMEQENISSGTILVKDGQPVLQADESTYPLIREDKSEDIEEINKELDRIVGLEPVKKYIHSLEAHVLVNQKRQQQGLQTAPLSCHMIFTGNPGTGKTTIARLIGRYMKAVGLLSEGQLVEVTRADLVARYVGQTAPQTRNVINSALGGVLFIDEAYSLYRGKDDSFGLEAIDTLVKGMEDNRDNLVVILAGYTKEMKDFLEANSGLKSRFANIIEFPDYTGKQLLQIAEIQAEQKGYRIDQEALAPLEKWFDEMQKDNAASAGNGRLARNTVESAILHQAERTVNDANADLSLLKKEDFSFANV